MNTEVKTLRTAVVILIAFALHACGGGGGGDTVAGAPGGGGGGGGGLGRDGGISGSGLSVGAVDGFGSVIVNNSEFNTSSAIITIEGAGALEDDLRVGQVVKVTADFDTLRASRIDYAARIKGPVQAISVGDAALGTATLTVLGQSVRTLALTNFDNASLNPLAANALTVGSLVEISGSVDANGVLIASFLERKTTLPEFKVIGRVSNLTATTFRIGTLTIDFSTASGTPVNGALVEVKGPSSGFNALSNTLTASSVSSVPGPGVSSNQSIEIEGYVTRFVSPTDFDVERVRVRTTATTAYANGSVTSLAANVKIEVEGVVDSLGVLVANFVEIQETGSIRLEGSIEQIDSARQQLRVLGVSFTVSAATDLEDDSNADADPLTFADLAVGDRVEMRGYLDGTTLIAVELERDDADSRARLRGPVTAESSLQARIAILGVQIDAGSSTQYRNEDDNPISRDAFHVAVSIGSYVTADWDNFTSAGAPPDELAIEDD